MVEPLFQEGAEAEQARAVSDAEVRIFQELCPKLSVLQLGREISPEAFDSLMERYRADQQLDMTDRAYAGLTAAGIEELAALCPALRAVFCVG